MKNVARAYLGRAMRKALHPLGLDIVRLASATATKPRVGLGYINAEKTVADAKERGLSVPDYLSELWGESGCVQQAISFIAQFPLPPKPTVLEIGAGSGRFLDQTIARLQPGRYLIYEPDDGWSEYLEKTYSVFSMPTNGTTLAGTADSSCDLIHAHYVFVYLPATVTFGYFEEICRALKPGGLAVFDIYSDDQASLQAIDEWRQFPDTFEVILPKSAVIEAFGRGGCDKLEEEIDLKVYRGHSRYLAFRKRLKRSGS